MQGPFRQVTDDYVKTCKQRRLAAMPVRPVPPTSKSPRLSFLRRCLAHDDVDAEQEDVRRHGSVQLQPERCPPVYRKQQDSLTSSATPNSLEAPGDRISR